jgi:hypothetical protein
VATYCHDLHKNYGKNCEEVNDLVLEKMNEHSILLTWSDPESSLPVKEYNIYRNDEFMAITTNNTYLDENLLVGEYEYYVVTHYEMDCISAVSNKVVENIEVGVNEIEERDIVLFPNPTTGELIIENGKLKIENVEILDIYGRKHLTVLQSYGLTVFKLDISHLKAGIYFIRMETKKGVITQKIIKY